MLDIVTEQPQTALPYHATEGNDIEPSLDSILFDGLEADQVVLIDNAAHRFLRKMPDQGPHLFLNVDRGEVARYSPPDSSSCSTKKNTIIRAECG